MFRAWWTSRSVMKRRRALHRKYLTAECYTCSSSALNPVLSPLGLSLDGPPLSSGEADQPDWGSGQDDLVLRS